MIVYRPLQLQAVVQVGNKLFSWLFGNLLCLSAQALDIVIVITAGVLSESVVVKIY